MEHSRIPEGETQGQGQLGDVAEILRSIKCLNHLEDVRFAEICKLAENLVCPAGSHLFSAGNHDDSIYVVQRGRISIYRSHPDGSSSQLKQFHEGETIHSPLSVLDKLTDHATTRHAMDAVAEEDTTVLRLRTDALSEVYARDPVSLIRIIQVLMVRLHRVVIRVLHGDLGMKVTDTEFDGKTSPFSQSENSDQNNRATPNHKDQGGKLRRESTSIDTEMLEKAKADIKQLIGLKDETLLNGKLRHQFLDAGTDVVDQDKDCALVFVISGVLHIFHQSEEIPTKRDGAPLFVVLPGDVTGGLALLCGEPSCFRTHAPADTEIVAISRQDFYSVLTSEPAIARQVARTVTRHIRSIVREVDCMLDWDVIGPGHTLYNQGDPPEGVCDLLTGKVRCVIRAPEGSEESVGQYGGGHLLGLAEVLAGKEYSTTARTIRGTEVVKIAAAVLKDMIAQQDMTLATRLLQQLSQRVIGTERPRRPTHPGGRNGDDPVKVNDVTTVAMVPVSEDVSLSSFTLELQAALKDIRSTLYLTSDIIRAKLGNAAFDRVNEYRLLSWLGQQEDIHRMVLYQCDHRMTPWTHHCIRQADCILIVGLGEKDPTVGKIVEEIPNVCRLGVERKLVLLHTEDTVAPVGTSRWLELLPDSTSHLHLRCPARVFNSTLSIDEAQRTVDRMSDVARLARHLTDTTVAVVLGGGGSRGVSHIGILRALSEAGIPVDMVGGTSIGSVIGALWCQEREVDKLTEKARNWAMKVINKRNMIGDLTYPATAKLTGLAYNDTFKEMFGEVQIEDLWLPYFCVTTDISLSQMRVHTKGSVWRYVRASASVPGYLPPLCDPDDGHLLVDGGYANNLPADVMKAMGANTILALDVSGKTNTELDNYGDVLSGWWLLRKRLNPFATPAKVPTLADIQSRLIHIHSAYTLDNVKNASYCRYIRAPIDRFRHMHYDRFDEICEVGYNYGKSNVETWVKTDCRDGAMSDSSDIVKKLGILESVHVDLACLVSEKQPEKLSEGNETTVSL